MSSRNHGTRSTTFLTRANNNHSNVNPPPPPQPHPGLRFSSPAPFPLTFKPASARAQKFFDDFTPVHRPFLVDVLKPPASNNAMFVAECYWEKAVRRAFEDWVGLLVCPKCGAGFWEMYNGGRGAVERPVGGRGEGKGEGSHSIEGDGATAEEVGIGNREDDAKNQKELSMNTPAPHVSEETERQKTKSKKKSKKRNWGDDPFDLLVGTKEEMLATKPWNLCKQLMRTWRKRWNRGCELWVLEEEVHFNLEEGEDDGEKGGECDGLEGLEWDWL